MTSAMLCVTNDLNDIKSDDCNETIAYAELQDGHPLAVQACVIGPKSTPYENDTFEVKIQFSDNYPFSPPTITFMADTNHPDAQLIGRFMTRFLQNSWTPKYTIKDILNLMLNLLHFLDIISNELEQIALAYEIQHLSIQ